MLWQWRVGVLCQLQRHLREPLPWGRVDNAPLGVDRSGWPKSTRALAIRFTWNLYPQVSIEQPNTGVRGWTHAKAAIRRVAPILRIRIHTGRRCPRTLA